MLASGWLGFAGVVLAAGAGVAEALALRAGDGTRERAEQMADLAEEFATAATAVLTTVEARTGALEAMVRQVLAAQPAPAPAAAKRAERSVRAAKRSRRPATAPPNGEDTSPVRPLAIAPAGDTSPELWPALTPGGGSLLVRKVAELAGAGISVPEIARRLGLSRGAVEVALRLRAQAAGEVQ